MLCRKNLINMKHYTHIKDLSDLKTTIKDAILLKMDPFKNQDIGKNKTLMMLFFNSSLRTRLSTEKAAKNLGMSVMTLDINNVWKLEFEDGSVMNMKSTEHIKEAAHVISQYADIIAIRAFPTLTDKNKDESELILKSFIKYATVPIISMESATGHPLQSLTDAITISEFTEKRKPRVVLTWAPHPKALPQAVANSFIETMQLMDVDFTITHPKGYELNPEKVKDSNVTYNQNEALKDADFVYAKNWSSYTNYGQILNQDTNWKITKDKLGQAKFMHCLPVRRNVVVDDDVLDSDQSIVIQQANNRTFAAQIVLKNILEQL